MTPMNGRYYEVLVSIETEDDKGRIKRQSVAAVAESSKN